MARKEKTPVTWTAIGPKGGPYRVRFLTKEAEWFPSTSELSQAIFFLGDINVNSAVAQLEALP